MRNINALTLDNCVFAFIDHQPFVAFPVRSISPEELINNVTGLAKVARALEIPTVLTTISAEGGPLADPLFMQLAQVFPGVKPIDRNNTNAWSDAAFVEAIKKTGRKKLVMCGLWTEVCLAQTVVSALKDGYEVYFVSDASGGLSAESHHDAKLRMVQAGAVPMTWFAVMSELCPDNSAPEYQRLYGLVTENGGGLAYNVQYVLAQLNRTK
ncbi:MAG TPA: hydrolase [Archangium sp.]|uniref:hydrolase n=1 Tax=Archangium sp. TaxID=1872627 RepID=UPI002E3596C1|nr:hydrolase [Archangium sp.]HEX5747180.1 hydrolase [Archangium sp.]